MWVLGRVVEALRDHRGLGRTNDCGKDWREVSSGCSSLNMQSFELHGFHEGNVLISRLFLLLFVVLVLVLVLVTLLLFYSTPTRIYSSSSSSPFVLAL